MGKQVKVVVSTPTNYRPATVTSPQTPTGTPLGSGAPSRAPSQTTVETGEGPTPEAKHPPQGARKPHPRSAPTTGPKIKEQSVDYDARQGSRIKKKPGGGVDYTAEQGQMLQDKGTP